MVSNESYSFPIIASICRDIIATPREQHLSKEHSRYMSDFLKYFNDGIRHRDPQIINLKLRACNDLSNY